MAGSVLLSLFCYTGYYGSDDMVYLGTIKRLARGDSIDFVLGAERFALLLPAVPVAWLTNGSNFAIIFSFALYFPVLVLLVYLLAGAIHDQTVARLAALVTMTSPLVYVFAGAILPDIPLTVWMTAALLFCCDLWRSPSAGWRRQAMICAAAGLCAGLAYSVKQTGLLIVLPCGAAIFLSCRPRFSPRMFSLGLAFLVGFGLVFLGEALLLYTLTGDIAGRQSLLSSQDIQADLREFSHEQGSYPWQRIQLAWMLLESLLGVYRYALPLALLLYFYFYREARTRWLGATLIWLPLYLTIGSISLTAYLPPAIVERYYVIAVPAGAIVLAAVGLRLLAARPARLALTSAVVLAIFVAQFSTNGTRSIYRTRETRAVIETVTAAKRQHAAFPLVLSEYVRLRFEPLFYPHTGRWFFTATPMRRRGAHAKVEQSFDEFLLLKMGWEWQPHLDRTRGAPHF